MQINIIDNSWPVISVPYAPIRLKILMLKIKKTILIKVFLSNLCFRKSLSIKSNKKMETKKRNKKFRTLKR